MSGGKGGEKTSKTEIPEWAEDATKRNLARAEQVQKIGYQPYYGPDVAAFTPDQVMAMQNNADAASAFGLSAPTDVAANLPQAQNFNGMMGYSSAPLYEQAIAMGREKQPGFYAAQDALFTDPNPQSQSINRGYPNYYTPTVSGPVGGGRSSHYGGMNPALTDIESRMANLRFTR